MSNNKRKVEDEPENEQSKKRANEESESDDDELDEELFDEEDEEEDGEDEEDSDQEFINKEIQVNFVAYNPDESDYDGMKRLLQQLWLKENINLNELADLMIEEATIASVLKQESDEESAQEKDAARKDGDHEEEDEEDKDDVYGLVCLVPMSTQFAAKNCVQQIKSLLCSRIPKENSIHQKLQDSKSTCALVINERFVNLPWRIALPCYEQLVKDLEEFESSEEDKSKYAFDSVVMICKVLKPKDPKANDEYVYSNPEEEVFDQSADASFEYSVSDQCDSDVFDWNDDENLYEPFRRVLLFSKDKWTSTVNSLKNVE